ncbi:M20 family metallopeptidase [Mycetocola sp.]|uniref:M20 family metallopeptidase n=1 Tax=Mycetocola sp. TaxID=1871042 RepID=UPI00398A1FB1
MDSDRSRTLTATELPSTVSGRIQAEIESHRDRLLAFSHRLHENPETAHREVKASSWLADELRAVTGARVEHGLGNLATAVRGEIGTGDFVVTVCAEYDALPGVGHACGHNIIATAALGAFVALAPLVDELGLTVRLLGTPAEEAGGGKIDLLRKGQFDGSHAVLMVHPGPEDRAKMATKACAGYRVDYEGASAHASVQPWLGVNALDAMTIALTSIGLARQQLKPGQQIHGMISEGGDAPNIIPGTTSGLWMIRADSIDDLKDVHSKLTRCFEAGALATGATLSITRSEHPYSAMTSDAELNQRYFDNAAALGRDIVFSDGSIGGSTDMANVSNYFPSIHPTIGVGADAPPMHSAAFAETAASAAGDAAAIDAAVALALTAADAATDPVLRSRLIARPAPDTSDAGSELGSEHLTDE